MKKNIFPFILFLFCILGCAPNKAISTQSSQTLFRIGYCPTMQKEINRISSDDYALEKVRYATSVQVIQALNAGGLDAAIIGQKPYPNELVGEMTVRQVRDGLTLVASQQKVVPYTQLSEYLIHTYLSPAVAENSLPEGIKIIYHTGPDPAFTLDQKSALLIEWSQITSDYQLLIPVDGQGNKIPAFRTPFLIYSSISTQDMNRLIEDILRSLS